MKTANKKFNDILPYSFLKMISNLPYVESIWLFGSRARQTARKRSDIDLAILCPKASLKDWQHIEEIIESADTLLKIDYIRFDTLSDPILKKEILKDKVIIFERKKHE